jgi:hypothetical protein
MLEIYNSSYKGNDIDNIASMMIKSRLKLYYYIYIYSFYYII